MIALVLFDVKVLLCQVLSFSKAAAASCRPASSDLTRPYAESLVCRPVALVWSWVSGTFSRFTNWVTMDLTSNPLPTPGVEMVALTRSFSAFGDLGE